MEQKFEEIVADASDLELTEDYIVLDDVGSMDLSNLRKRKIKIISSAKETFENGWFFLKVTIHKYLLHKSSFKRKKEKNFMFFSAFGMWKKNLCKMEKEKNSCILRHRQTANETKKKCTHIYTHWGWKFIDIYIKVLVESFN